MRYATMLHSVSLAGVILTGMLFLSVFVSDALACSASQCASCDCNVGQLDGAQCNNSSGVLGCGSDHSCKCRSAQCVSS